MIANALKMSLKTPIYRYVRTKAELEHFVDEFKDSNYRYLHISCHGSATGVFTTLDELSILDFAGIVGPALDGKRLFLSTCTASNAKMAKAVFSEGGCTSLVGPVSKINFDDSVVLWTSFYHLMFKVDAKRMVRNQIEEKLSSIARLLDLRVNFFASRNGKLDRSLKLPRSEPSKSPKTN